MATSTSRSNDSGRPRVRALWCATAASLLAVCVIWWPGCRKYPPATSREAYTLMEALYTACNTRNADSLNKIERWVNEAARERRIGPAEQDAFARIIAAGRSGQWREATQEAFRFSQDQVGRGKAFARPQNHGGASH